MTEMPLRSFLRRMRTVKCDPWRGGRVSVPGVMFIDGKNARYKLDLSCNQFLEGEVAKEAADLWERIQEAWMRYVEEDERRAEDKKTGGN